MSESISDWEKRREVSTRRSGRHFVTWLMSDNDPKKTALAEHIDAEMGYEMLTERIIGVYGPELTLAPDAVGAKVHINVKSGVVDDQDRLARGVIDALVRLRRNRAVPPPEDYSI